MICEAMNLASKYFGCPSFYYFVYLLALPQSNDIAVSSLGREKWFVKPYFSVQSTSVHGFKQIM